MNDTEYRKLFETVMDSMVRARWLRSYRFTEGKGFHLDWTSLGVERSVLLKNIVLSHGLDHDDRSPVLFTKLAHGESLGNLGRVPDEEILAYWVKCLGELGLGTEEELLGFCQVVKHWAPEVAGD